MLHEEGEEKIKEKMHFYEEKMKSLKICIFVKNCKNYKS
jgi:hypothetical protein